MALVNNWVAVNTWGAAQSVGTVTAGFAANLYSVKYQLSGVTVNFKITTTKPLSGG